MDIGVAGAGEVDAVGADTMISSIREAEGTMTTATRAAGALLGAGIREATRARLPAVSSSTPVGSHLCRPTCTASLSFAWKAVHVHLQPLSSCLWRCLVHASPLLLGLSKTLC